MSSNLINGMLDIKIATSFNQVFQKITLETTISRTIISPIVSPTLMNNL